jgi:hypothetical protein
MEERLLSFVGAWPPRLRADLEEYLLTHDGGQPATPRTPSGAPYWLWLPRELWASYAGGRAVSNGSIERSFLEDVLWGQYCLFLFVRIQDDLFDGQTSARSLLYVADQFLVESERAFAVHLRLESIFWSEYRRLLQITTMGILEVDALQRRRSRRGLLQAYKRVASIFHSGTLAVCLGLGRTRPLSALVEVSNDLSVAGQIVDDLLDIGEDLERGRWNFVALSLLHPEETVRLDAAACRLRLAETLWSDQGAARVLGRARRHLNSAARRLNELEVAGAAVHLERLESCLSAWRDAFHRAQLDLFFARARDALETPHSTTAESGIEEASAQPRPSGPTRSQPISSSGTPQTRSRSTAAWRRGVPRALTLGKNRPGA